MSSPLPRIAIVDDDDSVRHSLQWLMESAGYAVDSYSSGADLISDLEHSRPACAILDVHMPGLNGVDVHDQLTARCPDLPVIFITGHPEHKLSVQARAAHPAAFFSKPVDIHALLDRLQSLFAGDGV